MDFKDFLNVQEKLLEAQMNVIRELKQHDTPSKRRKITQIDMVIDILNDAGRFLHIQEIITRVKQKHGIELDREIIVSSMAKKITKGHLFKRVAPNTYDLLQR